ncbi:MAG TPA: SRPBCC family protein [Vicinamibacterales bacterium]|nr:SRPBCC family protein [Vicinamibacterales bacterium]
MTTPQRIRGDEPGRPAPIGAGELSSATRSNGSDGRLGDGLGWFSLVLGGAEMAAPSAVARVIGIRDTADNRLLLRALGAREIVSGLGILTRDRQAAWLWSRVAGDAIDLALLGTAYRSQDTRSANVAMAAAAVAGVTLLDLVAGRRRSAHDVSRRLEHVTKAMTVNRPPAEVYEFWRNFENLPRFMRHLASVEVTGPGRSRWVARGPGGVRVRWDAEVVEERPGEFIAWRSLPGAAVENAGWVSFRPAPGDRGTEVSVRLTYHPPAGRLGAGVAWLFGREPEQQLREDMRRFKQVMETGEIARAYASEGPLGMRAGQPGPTTPYTAFARGER